MVDDQRDWLLLHYCCGRDELSRTSQPCISLPLCPEVLHPFVILAASINADRPSLLSRRDGQPAWAIKSSLSYDNDEGSIYRVNLFRGISAYRHRT